MHARHYVRFERRYQHLTVMLPSLAKEARLLQGYKRQKEIPTLPAIPG